MYIVLLVLAAAGSFISIQTFDLISMKDKDLYTMIDHYIVIAIMGNWINCTYSYLGMHISSAFNIFSVFLW